MPAINKLEPGQSVSHVNVVVETPGGSRCKLDHDPKTGLYVLGKMLPSGFEFPFDFGFIPGTLADDGDPLDVMLIAEACTATGCLVTARAIGIVEVLQKSKGGKAERNDRVLAIPRCSQMYSDVRHGKRLPKAVISEVEYFLTSYGSFEKKHVRILRYRGPDEAWRLILQSKKKASGSA